MTGRVIAMVLAGGSGTRMGTDANKVYLPLADVPILAYSLIAFEACAAVTDIVLVARPADAALTADAVVRARAGKVRVTVPGGATRQGSERAGLTAVGALDGVTPDDLVLIHDGARPFVTVELIGSLVTAARAHGGAIPGLPFTSAVHELGAADARLRSVDTAALRRVQTPQAFPLGVLVDAYAAARANGFDGVDTADTVRHHHVGAQPATPCSIAIVSGDARNLKVTTPEDLAVATDLAAQWTHGGWAESG